MGWSVAITLMVLTAVLFSHLGQREQIDDLTARIEALEQSR